VLATGGGSSDGGGGGGAGCALQLGSAANSVVLGDAQKVQRETSRTAFTAAFPKTDVSGTSYAIAPLKVINMNDGGAACWSAVIVNDANAWELPMPDKCLKRIVDTILSRGGSPYKTSTASTGSCTLSPSQTLHFSVVNGRVAGVSKTAPEVKALAIAVTHGEAIEIIT
jgi:hypothetical protein